MPTRSLAPKTTPLSPKAHSKPEEKKKHGRAVPKELAGFLSAAGLLLRPQQLLPAA
jgi:hypothetical protein